MNTKPFTLDQAAAETQRFMVKVYGWMCLALVITGFVAMYTASTPALLNFIFSSKWMFFGLIILEFVAVGVLVSLINKMTSAMGTVIFIVYSILNGLTLSLIFVVYTEESISSTFFVTAGTFAVMSIYGYTTKTDLTKWGNILFMGVIGLIIASIANYFMQSSTLYWITTYAGVLIRF